MLEVTTRMSPSSSARVGQRFCAATPRSPVHPETWQRERERKSFTFDHLIFLPPPWGLITHVVWAQTNYHQAKSHSINFKLLIIRLDRSFKASVDSLQLTYSCQLENHLTM